MVSSKRRAVHPSDMRVVSIRGFQKNLAEDSVDPSAVTRQPSEKDIFVHAWQNRTFRCITR